MHDGRIVNLTKKSRYMKCSRFSEFDSNMQVGNWKQWDDERDKSYTTVVLSYY